AARERRAVAAERLELALQERERLLGEAGADLAGVDELLVLHHADRQRSDARGSPALARRPAAHHHVLRVDVLDLDPVRGPGAGLVRAVELLRHHALDAQLARGLEQRPTLAAVVGRGAPGGALQLESLEQPAALLVRQR